MHLVSINTAKHADYLESNNIEPFIFFSGIVATFMLRCFSLKQNTISYPKANETGIDFYPLKIQLLPSLTFIELLGNIAKQYQQDCDHQRATQEIAMDFYPNVLVIDKKTWNGYIKSIEHTSDILTFIYDLDAQTHYIYCDSDYIPAYFAKYFEKLIDSVISEANSNLSDYALISQGERHKMLYEWNNTDKPYPTDITIHELFQQQAQKTPDNIAVVHHDQQLTYQQLNEQSNQLARYIRKKYCEKKKKSLMPDTLVAIYMEKSIDMIVAILGILKSGGAYVPIDPSYPVDRIQYILQHTKASIILTQPDIKSQLIQHIKGLSLMPTLLSLDQQAYFENPLLELNTYCNRSDSLAYVMYTSGTTGNPKGVMIEHMGIHSLLFNQDSISIKQPQNTLFLSNSAFDASTFEIYTSLLSGGKLVIPNYQRTLISSPYRLEQALNGHNIKTLWLTKTLFDYLYINKPDMFQRLNALVIGGEALNANLISQLINSRYAPKVVLNGYGPTESTTFTTVFPCKDDFIENVPIGKPLSNRRVYVLDSMKNIVPTGVIGELYIGGLGVARGYWRQPKLTDKSFIINPFSNQRDTEKGYTRLYKTGDLVRWLPDGNLEYIGRNDAQVKIRGYRIELDEIASRLIKVKEIQQSAVMVQSKNYKHEYKDILIAYYVSLTPICHRFLRKTLSDKLPSYMLPQKFIHLDKFPLTINGKLDSSALQQMYIDQNGASDTAKAPQYYQSKYRTIAHYAA